MGTTEVTNSQYVSFLNAVAASDPNSLYSASMGTSGGIVRSGVDGEFTYSVSASSALHPVRYVSYWDACRFANWMHNGQPLGSQGIGTTETGAYTLTPAGIAANTVSRNADWRWALPSADEWVKAAYYQPYALGGDYDNYWLYPTSTNQITTSMANYYGNGINTTTPVRTYAPIFFGLYDMGGNVWEFTEATAPSGSPGGARYVRGGSFSLFGSSMLRATFNGTPMPSSSEGDNVGIRLVQVPAPGAMGMLGIALACRRRRR